MHVCTQTDSHTYVYDNFRPPCTCVYVRGCVCPCSTANRRPVRDPWAWKAKSGVFGNNSNKWNLRPISNLLGNIGQLLSKTGTFNPFNRWLQKGLEHGSMNTEQSVDWRGQGRILSFHDSHAYLWIEYCSYVLIHESLIIYILLRVSHDHNMCSSQPKLPEISPGLNKTIQ